MLSNLNPSEKLGLIFISAIGGSLIAYKYLINPIYKAIKKQSYKNLKIMEEDNDHPNSQWAMIYGDGKKILESFTDVLKDGNLRIIVIVNRDEDIETVSILNDKVFSVKSQEEIQDFLTTRQIKLFINATPLSSLIVDSSDDNSWDILRNSAALMECVIENMERFGEGCMITLRYKEDPTAMQSAAGAYCSKYASFLCSKKSKKRIFSQEILVPKKEIAKSLPRLAKKSLENIGIENTIV